MTSKLQDDLCSCTRISRGCGQGLSSLLPAVSNLEGKRPVGFALRNLSGVMLLALQNPVGFGSPLSCWERDFGWSWLERVAKDFVHL